MEIVVLTTMKKHNKHTVINITRLKLIRQGHIGFVIMLTTVTIQFGQI